MIQLMGNGKTAHNHLEGTDTESIKQNREQEHYTIWFESLIRHQLQHISSQSVDIDKEE